MIRRLRTYLLLLLTLPSAKSQTLDAPSVLSLSEYISYVKLYHPVVKQANLTLEESEAVLLQARGAFDPNIQVDWGSKQFQGTSYYEKLNSTFTIPTWFGIEFIGQMEETSGAFVNPENITPDNALYSMGVAIPIARDLLINKRMAALKQAKIFKQQAAEEQQILLNRILYDAIIAYVEWLRAYNELQLFESFVENAQVRFDGIKRSVIEGELAAIDSLEARIILNDRKLSLENSLLNFTKARLELSNFLWYEQNIPLEIEENTIPDLLTVEQIDRELNILNLALEEYNSDTHPFLKSLQFQKDQQAVQRNLFRNDLLPRLDLKYNFLTTTPLEMSSITNNNYRAGIHFSYPLFLRRERANLRLASIIIRDLEYEIATTRLNIEVKIAKINRQIESIVIQDNFLSQIVTDTEQLLIAEERKFEMGESSIFLVNMRENNFIDAKLKTIALENNLLQAKAELFNAIIPQLQMD
jgi:outer membrane protein TolC